MLEINLDKRRDVEPRLSKTATAKIWLNVRRGKVYLCDAISMNNLEVDHDALNLYLSEDVFEDCSLDGLVCMIVELEFAYHCDYYGEWDLGIDCKKVFEGKCSTFGHLRDQWMLLKGLT